MSVQSKRHGKDYIRLYNIINYIKDYAVYLGNISKDFTVNNMKKNRVERKCKLFSVDFKPIDTNDILGIHKYCLIKRK